MPTGEPMANGEIARALSTINGHLVELRAELKDKPGSNVFSDYRSQQSQIHADLHEKINAVDSRQTQKNTEQDTAIKDINLRADKLLYGIITVALGAAANLITNISGG